MRLPALSLPPPIFAHLGHWYVSLPVFMGPVLLLLVALKVQTWREARNGPDTSGKRSTVVTTRSDGKTTITVTGPLDYPALLEIDLELGQIAQTGQAVFIDLRNTRVDEDTALSLCEIISGIQSASTYSDCGSRPVVLVDSGPTMGVLRKVCAAEGVPVSALQQAP